MQACLNYSQHAKRLLKQESMACVMCVPYKKKTLAESEERPAEVSWGIGLELQRRRNAPPTVCATPLSSTSS